jgi:hypothetical protein
VKYVLSKEWSGQADASSVRKIASRRLSHECLSKPLCEAASLALVDKARSDLRRYNFDADIDLSQFSL